MVEHGVPRAAHFWDVYDAVRQVVRRAEREHWSITRFYDALRAEKLDVPGADDRQVREAVVACLWTLFTGGRLEGGR